MLEEDKTNEDEGPVKAEIRVVECLAVGEAWKALF